MTVQEKQKQDVSFIPNTDLFATVDGWVVELDMPGADQQSIDVNVEGDTLKISGKINKPELQEDYEVLYSEYYTGNYGRTLQLPKDVDIEKIEATIKDGVLRLVLPKSEAKKPKKIEVKLA